MKMERGRPAPIGPGRPGSFWGHVDDPDFQAREARWAVERTAARDRFQGMHGAIARRELEGFLVYRHTVERLSTPDFAG